MSGSRLLEDPRQLGGRAQHQRSERARPGIVVHDADEREAVVVRPLQFAHQVEARVAGADEQDPGRGPDAARQHLPDRDEQEDETRDRERHARARRRTTGTSSRSLP